MLDIFRIFYTEIGLQIIQIHEMIYQSERSQYGETLDTF